MRVTLQDALVAAFVFLGSVALGLWWSAFKLLWETLV